MGSSLLISILVSATPTASQYASSIYAPVSSHNAGGSSQYAPPSSRIFQGGTSYAPASSIAQGNAPSSIQWNTQSAVASSSAGVCSESCSKYNSILVNCQSDASQEAVYKSCVCNDANFQSYVQQCISCEGTNSDPYKFQQNCKNVAPDCTVSCSQFGLILQSCGDASSSGFDSCVCGSAYDPTYTTTFNQAFRDCASCTSGGGDAATWEQKCCAQRYGCNGMSGQSNSQSGTGSASEANPSSTTASAGLAPQDIAVSAYGIGWMQLVLGAIFGFL